MPFAFVHIYFIIRKSNCIHLRSPGISTLIVNILNKITNKPTIVKWATVFENIKIPSKIIPIENSLLKSPPSNTKVLIYGKPSHENHVSSFPAMMSREEVSSFIKNAPLLSWKTPFKLICVARLIKHKDIDFLINALSSFDEKYKNINWTLDIVGTGPELNNLKSLVKKNELRHKIVFLGSLSFNKTIDQLYKAHIAIVPSRFEGWAKIINEAWMTNTVPLVVSEGNASHVVKLGKNAGLVYDYNYDSFSEKLKLALSLKEEYIRSIFKNGQSATMKMCLEDYKNKIKYQIENTFIKFYNP